MSWRAGQSVDRALEARRSAYAAEVQRLVDASFALVRDSDCLEPTVADIVKAAGLSNKAFYRHFRSKDELLLAVLDDGIRQLSSYLGHRMDAFDAPLERVRAWVAGVLEQALNPEAAAATRPFALSRARLSELFPDEVRESENQLIGMLRGAIVDAAEVTETDAARDAELIYNLAMGWVERRLARAEPPTRDEADHLVAFALRGLARPSDGPDGSHGPPDSDD